jgi:hypothetical protein
MKFDDLRSIGHNVAHSLASGIGLMIGTYEMDVFGEASRSAEGFIAVDFLTGQSEGGAVSAYLARAIELYREGLTDLCERHSTMPSVFRTLTARYAMAVDGGHFWVTVEDQSGHRAVDEYVGVSGRRVTVLDELGRVRRG